MDSRSFNEGVKIREKQQSLLQDYLVLQKECVSKKRKLKEAKEKKETLLDEIRFLKQRRDLLLEMQSQDLGQSQGVSLSQQAHNANHQSQQQAYNANHQSQKAQIKYEVGPSANYASTSESTFQIPRPVLRIGSIWNAGSVPKEEVGFAPVKVGKASNNMLANGKRAEKRKISWQDQLALKV